MIKFEKIEGINDVLRGFDEVGTAAFDEIEKTTVSLAGRVMTAAKAKVPGPTGRKTGKWAHPAGNLEEKIRMKKPTEKQKAKAQVFSTVGFGAGAAYGVPVELGHKLFVHGQSKGQVKPAPAPTGFLRPAADMYKSTAADEIEKAINDAIGKW
ncbi:hypothetical protein [Acidaminobacter hydrogenoformans]|uniref:Phage protein, HK97 gp10 family n=1 Tax=Acidaminobacter hydrogenoformans DSM 2784 TaxID=1120920 RepID=A0A1G5S4C7_9FIRM|nr:hypothetical protein [Acidaminobacter hydrogenoformans]SCZ80389.1 hypothetical protein SAMN03080599_02246 [Acidaminobacter hydrogenoformans DSM 2784]